MKVWLLNIVPAVAVLVTAAGSGHTHSTLLRWVLVFVASALIQIFFVQKWPKHVPLRWVVWKLRKGEKVEVEGL